MIDEDDYLLMSGIQHYCFCPRQWALIHVEKQWEDNYLTIAGELAHEKAHEPASFHKNSLDYFSCTAMKVVSSKLRMVGVCDVIEFFQDSNGVVIDNHPGKWRIVPIEYKHGSKNLLADKLQLCAECIALEEMFGCKIDNGFIFHFSSKKREPVEIDDSLRAMCVKEAQEMHYFFANGITPVGIVSKSCGNCSLSDICLPSNKSVKNAEEYIKKVLNEKDA